MLKTEIQKSIFRRNAGGNVKTRQRQGGKWEASYKGHTRVAVTEVDAIITLHVALMGPPNGSVPRGLIV